ncbi:hypothetical protein BOTBODRAFT_102009 [Botryobasidium botryosum FD-172 SS1]|uniref:GPI ethanolamine phosphate transferase 2 C-terminal domain-containing protein n=1 Tax=Botryobasidium botryosum (strain FD-172 SS1) TaxID=930990 RepID=A0A067N8I2_BOTB1|nr:hypothetical protein BOTBODRAFT_102009 [Botryobasidium botryosum FD-172 SS1]
MPWQTWLPTKHALAALVLSWVLFVHSAGLFLFTRGFLLTRLSLEDLSTCPASGSPCTLPPQHQKAVILIIDALRFDFISPHPPSPPSPNFHHVLTLPAELTAAHPDRSFLFQAFADPPTTTLQRIKGITTGSLPTFIDMGSNFGGTQISEDSLITQLRRAGKNIALLGDDTWMGAYPTSFYPNATHPFDSFNVEDLHTVDEGVIRYLFPLLENKSEPWDVIIGHFLGVDHVGHRFMPEHPVMKSKLMQMNRVLKRVVDSLDDDTLLVLLGDHGMDARGDHGGDAYLETASALWIYSKRGLSRAPIASALGVTPFTVFQGAAVPARLVQQIDLVPTLSLLLGLPIPFNNLGSVIPELFSTGQDTLSEALRINTEQVWNYLRAYRSSASGGELDSVWDALSISAKDAQGSVRAQVAFMRQALETCREMWAQFNVVRMVVGLSVLALSIPTLCIVYLALGEERGRWEDVGKSVIIKGTAGALTGGMAGFGLHVFSLEYLESLSGADLAISGAAIVSELVVILSHISPARSAISSLSSQSLTRSLLPALILILHALAFTSNSFTIWEDRIVPYFFITLLTPVLFSAFSAPTAHLRRRLLYFAGLAGVCARAMSVNTVCREEQQPQCHVTFFSTSVLPFIAPLAYFIPVAVRRFLAISKSDKGIAPFFLNAFWRTMLVGGAAYWLVEWTEGAMGADAPSQGNVWVWGLRLLRTGVARVILGSTLVGGYVLWWNAPLCVELRMETPDKPTKDAPEAKKIVVLGFANTYGSSYLLFVLVFFALLFTVTPPTGQVALATALVTILAYLEVVDSQRDVAALEQSFSMASPSEALDLNLESESQPRSMTFSEPAAIALLSILTFFSTGHQATISSIQWKTAFVGFSTLTYPFAPVLVAMNTFGPLFFVTLAVPLFAMWNVSPIPKGRVSVLADTMTLALGTMLYWTTIGVGSAGSAALLRRHLMVWKIFAPRFMLGGVALVVVDVALLVAVGVGSLRVSAKVKKMFGTEV